jgi:RIO kinase 2
MRLEASSFRYLTKDDIRILTAVEMGLKNHEYVPEQLVEAIAQLRRCGVFSRIQQLIKHRLLHYEGGKADGYKLTYNGYDCLALRALTNRGIVDQVGTRIGVGKESDIHMCSNEDGRAMVVKFHRLGRISFRTVKTNRDYLEGRSHASWLYLARLAAKKEFQYMQALHAAGFPVPEPIDNNRHAVVMEYMSGSVPLNHIDPDLTDKEKEVLLTVLFSLLLRFASCGLVHGDFNEFNLLVDMVDVRKVTVIDFPQIILMTHPEAQHQFERDVGCIVRFFAKRFRFDVAEPPTWAEAWEAYQETIERQGGNALVVIENEEDVEVFTPDRKEQDSDDQESEEGSDEEVEDDSAEDRSEESEDDEGDSRVIRDPRHVLREKKKKEAKLAPKIVVARSVKPGQSHAKPNRQKRSQNSNAAREVRAWKTEGGW